MTQKLYTWNNKIQIQYAKKTKKRMFYHLLRTGEIADRSEHSAARTRALLESSSKRHNEYTSLQILASNDGTLLATNSCDALHHLGSCNS